MNLMISSDNFSVSGTWLWLISYCGASRYGARIMSRAVRSLVSMEQLIRFAEEGKELDRPLLETVVVFSGDFALTDLASTCSLSVTKP
jgi:hypothetical protein